MPGRDALLSRRASRRCWHIRIEAAGRGPSRRPDCFRHYILHGLSAGRSRDGAGTRGGVPGRHRTYPPCLWVRPARSYVQYFDWLFHAVQGDFGRSHYLNEPAANVIFDRLPVDHDCSGRAPSHSPCFSPSRLACWPRSGPTALIDRFALTIAVIGQAMPTFWFALTMMLWFGITWRIVANNRDSQLEELRHAGDCTWLLCDARRVMRLTRAGMLEVLASDYIRTARAKGLQPYAGAVQACASQCYFARCLAWLLSSSASCWADPL